MSGRNGQLRGDLRSGVSLDEFRHGLLEGLRDPEAVNSSTVNINSTVSPDVSTASTSRNIEGAGPATSEINDIAQPAVGHVYHSQAIPSTSSTPRQLPTQSPLSQPLSSDAQATLAERCQRLETDRLQREAQGSTEQQARTADQQEEQASKASNSPARVSQISHAQQQRKRKQEARQERERILKIIENDKLERRHQSQLQREYNETRGGQKTSARTEAPVKACASSPVTECALRVRLLDGSSINTDFPASQNLHIHVRKWIDSERKDGDAPYSFKQIMAPGRNRAIEVSQEMESLQVLGLVPNATLLMVPAKGVSAAYASNARNGVVGRVVVSATRAGAAIYGFIWSLWAIVTGALWTFLGIGNRPAPPRRDQAAERRARKTLAETRAESIVKTSGVTVTGNVRTLRDRDERKDDRQFYNGNQVRILQCSFSDILKTD